MPPNPAVPPVPTIPPELADSSRTTQTAIEALTGTVTRLIGGIDTLVNKFMGGAGAAGKMAGASTNAGAAFDFLATGILGATTAFDSFNDHAKSLSGFENQLNSAIATVPGMADALQKLAIAAGAPASIINGGSKILGDFVVKMAQSADAALKLQNGHLAMMGATGGLNAVFDAAGDHLQNLNDVIFKQSKLIGDIAGATSSSMAEVTRYYDLLGSIIPGSVDQQIEATDSAGKSYNTLSGAMTLATGTGRTVEAVVNDMKVAWEAYGQSGDEALQFTARISELSNKFGINLEYVGSFVKENARAFHLIAQGGDNATESLNRLYSSFKNTGLSAKDSTEMIGHMTGQMAKLTIGQKAFLSAQSGGPGGLRGALQIEKQLRDKDVDGVLKKAEAAVKKQFGGRIYTQEDGSKSEFAAAQFMKQRAMLRSGAFGGLAKDDDSATRILEAFKNGTSGVDDLQDPAEGLKSALSNGDMLQQTANTELSKIRLAVERQQALSAFTDLKAIQSHLGSKFMTRGADGQKRAANLRQKGINDSHESALTLGVTKQPGALDVNKIRNDNAVDILMAAHAVAPAIAKPMIEKMIAEVTGVGADSNKTENIKVMNALRDKLQKQQSNAAAISAADGKPTQANEEDGKLLALINKTLSIYSATDVNNGALTGQAVNASLASAYRPTTPQEKNQAVQTPGQHLAQAKPQKMEVTFKAICFKCNKPQEADAATRHISGGAPL